MIFEVTTDWIEAHQTDNGGWTRDQLAQIGVQWPPLTGWKHRTAGLRISEEQRARFEAKIPA